MSDIRSAIAAIVSEVRQAEITPADHARPLKELAVDSLDIANILLAVEEKYGLKIPDADVDRLTTLASIVEYVQSRIQTP